MHCVRAVSLQFQINIVRMFCLWIFDLEIWSSQFFRQSWGILRMSECKVYLGNLSYDTGERWADYWLKFLQNWYKALFSQSLSFDWPVIVTWCDMIHFLFHVDLLIVKFSSLLFIYSSKNWWSFTIKWDFILSFENAHIQYGLCQITSLLKFRILSVYKPK